MIDKITGKYTSNTHALLPDNSTRWNSAFYLLDRGIEQQPVIVEFMDELAATWDGIKSKYQRDHPGKDLPASILDKRPSVLDDWLSANDWKILIDYKTILQPLEEATLILQGHGEGGSYGVIWQIIPVMEGLLKHFEQLKDSFKLAPSQPVPIDLSRTQDNTQQSTQATEVGLNDPKPSRQLAKRIAKKSRKQSTPPATTELAELSSGSPSNEPEYYIILCQQINQAWAKLEKYYEATDSSAAYVAALALHPAFTWEYLENIWKAEPCWIRSAKQRVQRLWNKQLEVPVPAPLFDNSTTRNRRHKSSLFDLDDDIELQEEDDYVWWCRRPRDRSLIELPSLEFWYSSAMKQAFPRLQKLALTIFTIPGMSDEPERCFSSTGVMIQPRRGTISPKHAAAAQCLKSWSNQGLATFSIFDRMAARLQSLESAESEQYCGVTEQIHHPRFLALLLSIIPLRQTRLFAHMH